MVNVLDVSLDVVPSEIHSVAGKRNFRSLVDNLDIKKDFNK